MLAGLGLAAFILNVDNRFTSGGLFFYPPAVDLIPPLTGARWDQAFTQHQTDPVFAACGGTESLGQFQTLYMWEWLRQASALVLVVTAAAGTAAAVLWPRWRSTLPRVAALWLIAAAYVIASALLGVAVAHVADLSRFNVGQYRHAVEVGFASAGVAALLVSAIRPPVGSPPARPIMGQWLWLGAILLDIAFGAVFAARDAMAVWTSLGHGGKALPPLDRLLSYSALWLNPFVNQYAIQLIHRTLSIGLYLYALVWLLWAIRRGRRETRGRAVPVDELANGNRHRDARPRHAAGAFDHPSGRCGIPARGRLDAWGKDSRGGGIASPRRRRRGDVGGPDFRAGAVTPGARIDSVARHPYHTTRDRPFGRRQHGAAGKDQ